jgi:hypothetical protein
MPFQQCECGSLERGRGWRLGCERGREKNGLHGSGRRRASGASSGILTAK